MSLQIRKQVDRIARVLWIALVVLLGSQVMAGQANPQAPTVQPMVITQVFDVSCASLISITPTYEKLVDLATFNVQSPNSTVELTFNGRIYMGVITSGSGAVFELRVDDVATGMSRARANLREAEAGGGGRQASITGYFSGLAAGEHTASM